MAKAVKTINVVLDDQGKWTAAITVVDLPLTLRDIKSLYRAVLVAQRVHLREWNLKQYALRQERDKRQKRLVELLKKDPAVDPKKIQAALEMSDEAVQAALTGKPETKGALSNV